MARSSYIYVVLCNGLPVAAFTVKHEFISWAGKQTPLYLASCSAFRLRDGGHKEEPVILFTMSPYSHQS